MKNVVAGLSVTTIIVGMLSCLGWQTGFDALNIYPHYLSVYPVVGTSLVAVGILLHVFMRFYKRLAALEQKLAVAEKAAEEANQCKANFLSSMSHEVRTPLNGIVGFADILSTSDLSKEQQQEYLRHIKTSGNLLVNLMSDILEFNKAGKLELKKESFQIKERIEKDVFPFRQQAKQKNLDFTLAIDKNLPNNIIGDEGRFSHVIFNLLDNAIKFTEKGKIALEVLRVYENGDEVLMKILVSDTGIGVSKDNHEKIFDSFSQLDNSSTRKYKGSGLGLAMVKHLVSAMNGTVNVISPFPHGMPDNSAPGSCFEILIPAQIDRKQTGKVIDMEAYFRDMNFDSKVSVLIVEDNLLNQKLAVFILKKIGCVYELAENGAVALNMMRQKNYDLVLMDVQMPVMDGLEASQIIRKDLGSEIPIIGVTANVFKEDIDSCLRAGMNDHLGKPYNEEQLIRIIHKWSVAKKAV